MATVSTIQKMQGVVVLKKVGTVSFEEVKTLLRRGGGGSIRNHGGWCVYINKEGQTLYVVDDSDARPVAFQRIRPLRPQRISATTMTISSLN